MSQRPARSTALILVFLGSLSMAACGQGAIGTTVATEFSFGSSADVENADREIEIRATDSLTFEPDDVTVEPGETIVFRIVNTGSQVHDFTLGDQATQDAHEAEMAEMGGMAHDQANVVTIPAGGTAELAWTFAKAGTVIFGCHQPGHYVGGMSGLITVEG